MKPGDFGQVVPLSFTRVPIAWVALTFTAGIIADRVLGVPPQLALAFTAATLTAWLVKRDQPSAMLLLTGVAALGAYHHHRHHNASDDIRRLATEEGQPICLRGTLIAPPTFVPALDDPMQLIPRPEATRLLIRVTHVVDVGAILSRDGKIVAYLAGMAPNIAVGDEMELRGRLVAPRRPGNPGEFDAVQELRDQGVGAILSLSKSSDAVRILDRRWPMSPRGWLGRFHQHAKATLHDRLRAEPELATALLLGDGSGLARPTWDRYLKTGIVHALAISGQHLVVLAALLGFLRRFFTVRLTTAAVAIAGFLFFYALLTGGRPPVMRAAWMVVFALTAMWMARPTQPAAALAGAWIAVAVFNPADLFQVGCQLTFLAVLVLQWGVQPWLRRHEDEDPLTSLIRETEPRLITWLRIAGRRFGEVYAVNAVVWIAVTPLLAGKFHLVSPIALVIGPPIVVLTSAALISGFLLLLTAPLLGPLAQPFAWGTDLFLLGCEEIVNFGGSLPFAYFYVAEVPAWWTVVFYVGLIAVMLWWHADHQVHHVRQRTLSEVELPRGEGAATRLRHGRRRVLVVVSALALGWIALGSLFAFGLFRPREFRLTFVAVGHGGCVVMETAGGRVLVYDAGAMSGSDVTRRQIAPFLWSRGIRRIDDLLISHADLDHFSGVPELMDRFHVEHVTLTPSFADRPTPGVQRVLSVFKTRDLAVRIVRAGDEWQVDEVKLDLLHPPPQGPEGKENVRSMVLRLRVGHFATLLTGDLEGTGLAQVLALRPPAVDVFMAPHHGSVAANPEELARWAHPKVAISCQGWPRSLKSPAAAYERVGARYLTTHDQGAITLTHTNHEFMATTFRTSKAISLGRAPVR